MVAASPMPTEQAFAEQQRTAVALAIIQARRQAGKSREWQRRAEQAEQSLAAYQSAQQLLLEMLQLSGKQPGEQLQALLRALAASEPPRTLEGRPDLATGLTTTIAQLHAVSTVGQDAAASQQLLQHRRAGLDVLLRHAHIMRVLLPQARAPPAQLSTAPHTSQPATLPCHHQPDLQALLSFISDTLLHLPPSDLHRSYLHAAITGLAALLNTTHHVSVPTQQGPATASLTTSSHTGPVLQLMQQLVKAAGGVATSGMQLQAHVTSTAHTALQAVQQHASLGPLLLLAVTQLLHAAVQDNSCLSSQLVPALAAHLADTASLRAATRDHNTCTTLMQQLAAQQRATAGLVRMIGSSIQRLPGWLQACMCDGDDTGVDSVDRPAMCDFSTQSQVPLLDTQSQQQHYNDCWPHAPALYSLVQALEAACSLLIADYQTLDKATTCRTGSHMAAMGVRMLMSQLAATLQHMLMLLGPGSRQAHVSDDVLMHHTQQGCEGRLAALSSCKERLLGLCMRLRAALAPAAA